MLGDVRAARRGQELIRVARVAATAAVLVLAGCAGSGGRIADDAPAATAGRVHVVRSGETLYGIATRYGLDYRELARWNRLGDGALIYPGQRLRLEPPGAATSSPAGPGPGADAAPARWQWPTAGALEQGFGQSPRTASGVVIGGRAGQPVVAAADGEVVYAGTGLAGYGLLLIVRHNDAWLSAYGHCQEALVAEGERVRAGQEIAQMGEGPGRRPALHFEIRRDGAPVDPLRYLPSRR